MITLTKEEATAFRNTLGNLAFNSVAHLIMFLDKKMEAAIETEKAQTANQQIDGQPVEG